MKYLHKLCAFILLTILFATPALAATVRITGGETNIRRTPTLNGEIIGKAHEGDEFEYWDQSSTDDRGVVWYNIIYGNISAWVSSKYASLQGAGSGSAGSSSSSASGSASGTVSITGDANIRKGPGLGYDSITTVNGGSVLEYCGESSTDDRGVAWYKVRKGSTTGWVSSKFAVLASGDEADICDYYWEKIESAAQTLGCRYTGSWNGEDGIGAEYEGSGLVLREAYGTGRVQYIGITGPCDYTLLGLRYGMSRSEVRSMLSGVESQGDLYMIRGTFESPLIMLEVVYDGAGKVSLLGYGLFQ